MREYQISNIHTIAILGGTGKEGKGLGYCWAKAGYQIVIGSRHLEKAQLVAAELKDMLKNAENVNISGATNEEAAKVADLVVLTVPFSAQSAILETIRPFVQAKIFIDVTVPLVPPKVTRVQMPAAGSAAMQAQQILGDGVDVVSAFQNISYENLLHMEKPHCDVLVTSENKSARVVVVELVRATGLVGWDAGPLNNAMVAEGLTSVLIHINKQFGIQASGIQITGVPQRS